VLVYSDADCPLPLLYTGARKEIKKTIAINFLYCFNNITAVCKLFTIMTPIVSQQKKTAKNIRLQLQFHEAFV